MNDHRRLRVHLSAEANEAPPLEEAFVPVEADALLPLGEEIGAIGARVYEKESPFALLNSRKDGERFGLLGHLPSRLQRCQRVAELSGDGGQRLCSAPSLPDSASPLILEKDSAIVKTRPARLQETAMIDTPRKGE